MDDNYSHMIDYKIIQENRDKYKTLKTAFGTNYRMLNVPMARRDNGAMPTNDSLYNIDPRGYLNGT
jgi:hypothetical protein